MITFTPLAGDANSPPYSPLAYLLQIDEVRILLDCGAPDWTTIPSSSIESYVTALRNCSSIIDLVLFTHGDLKHTGLYAYARTHWSLFAPAYATLPVKDIARVVVAEESEELQAERNLDVDMYIASTAEISSAFEAINTVRYSEPTHLQGKCTGLTITPFGAGHSLGGTLWKIRSPSNGTVLYAVDLNHTRGRCFDGTALLKPGSGGEVFEPLSRPDLLITDAAQTLTILARRKDREAAFIDAIATTLSNRRSVLIPVDLDSRLLEILVLLDLHWSFAKMRQPICIVSKNGESLLKEVVPTLLEWFGGDVAKGIVAKGIPSDDSRWKKPNIDSVPFGLRHFEFFDSPEHLLQRYGSKDAKVIIAVPYSLSYGPSRTIFAEHGIAEGEGNLVLLLKPESPELCAGYLWQRWREAQGAPTTRIGEPVPLKTGLSLIMKSKVPLSGQELTDYLAAQRATMEKEAAQAASLERDRRLLEAEAEEESDSDSDSNSDDNDMLENEGHDTSIPELMGPVAEPGGYRVSRRRRNEEVDPLGAVETFFNLESDTPQNYDTYIKGSSFRSGGFFKQGANPKDRERHRMFPFAELRKIITSDGYGDQVDVNGWIRKGKELQAIAEEEADTSRNVIDGRTQKADPNVSSPQPPAKFTSRDVDLRLSCTVFYVDVGGVHDGRAVKTIVPQLMPRKMMIIHAEQDATEALKNACANIQAMSKDIYSPVHGEDFKIGQYTRSFAIALSDELLSKSRLSKFEDSDIGLVVGIIGSHISSALPVLEPPLRGDHEKQLIERWPLALPHSNLIGDLRLTILKLKLARSGISAEFAGEGVLLCSRLDSLEESDMDVDGEVVVVRKIGRDKAIIEGSPCDLYFEVRNAVYGLHAVISG